jgi:hypothetical protein
VFYDNGFITVTLHRRQAIEEREASLADNIDVPDRLHPSQGSGPGNTGDSIQTVSRTEISGRIGVWGAVGSGKTTFLAALYIAVNRSAQDLSIFGMDDTSSEFMVESTRMLTNEHRFPDATMLVGSYSWTMNMTTLVDKTGRSWSGKQPTVPVAVTTQFNIDLRDAPGGYFASEPMGWATESRLDLGDGVPEPYPGPVDMMEYLAGCEGLLLFIDPVRERAYGDAYEYFQGTLLRIVQHRMPRLPPGAKLPHYVAVCITKFDHPEVYRFAQENGHITYDEDDPYCFPRVADHDAQHFFQKLSDMDDSYADLICKGLARYFYPERIRYFVTSSIGFYATGGQFREDDHDNAMEQANGSIRIRGSIHPINVLEPILWVGQSLASEKRRGSG